MNKIRAVLAMFAWWRHLQCARGGPVCWECRAYDAWMARVRREAFADVR